MMADFNPQANASPNITALGREICQILRDFQEQYDNEFFQRLPRDFFFSFNREEEEEEEEQGDEDQGTCEECDKPATRCLAYGAFSMACATSIMKSRGLSILRTPPACRTTESSARILTKPLNKTTT